MAHPEYQSLAAELAELLGLQHAPLAITFSDRAPEGVAPFNEPMPPAGSDGRTGRVSAGCVFWMKGETDTFTTVAEDHANCSVGSLTHGFKSLDEVGENADVAALLESGWVRMEMVPQIPVVASRARHVTYGPLARIPVDPDVVFLRINAKQAMVLSDALPGLRFEGKPQCHIIPIAKEQGEVAVSVGCMLSRVRTGMPNTDMTCAMPARRLAEIVDALKETCRADKAVAAYASQDAGRFSRQAPRA